MSPLFSEAAFDPFEPFSPSLDLLFPPRNSVSAGMGLLCLRIDFSQVFFKGRRQASSDVAQVLICS
jgi:hypothetical protein